MLARYRRSAPRSSPSLAEPERPYLEVQYHPGDIRRGVRYFFFSQKQVVRLGLGFLVWSLVVGTGLWLAPSVLSDGIAASRYDAREQDRERLAQRLEGLVERLGALDQQAEEVGVEMAKIYLAYGFDPAQLEGQGGFPFGADGPLLEGSAYSEVAELGGAHRSSIREELAVLDVFLDEVVSFEAAHRDEVRTTPAISPLRGRDFVLTSPFARRRNPFTKGVQFHSGIDLAAPVGTPIVASADGLVSFAGWYSLSESAGWWRYGRLVAINHDDRFITLYGHCDEVLAKAGQTVKQGDVIATVGNTGWSTSPHLHYEVRRIDTEGEYTPVDPRIYILDHRWRNEERVLIRARSAPSPTDFEPLPSRFSRRRG